MEPTVFLFIFSTKKGRIETSFANPRLGGCWARSHEHVRDAQSDERVYIHLAAQISKLTLFTYGHATKNNLYTLYIAKNTSNKLNESRKGE
jgi:hypothetical protein